LWVGVYVGVCVSVGDSTTWRPGVGGSGVCLCVCMCTCMCFGEDS